MLNGIFGKWLREFATLVFTQAVQAFLLAIVMTIIISCLGNSTGDAETGNQAAGLLAIIALASFGKIEMLVKNIFGVTSQFGDPSLQAGARGLTAGTMLAMKGGKRLLDNGSKLIQSHRQISEAKKGLAAYGTGETAGLEAGEEGAEGSAAIDKLAKQAGVDPAALKTVTEGAEDTLETSVQLQGLENLGQLNSAINNLTRAMEKQSGGSNKEKYEKMLEEGKNLRRSAIRENIGAAIGGTAGAIVGLAKGDNIIETTLAGAGAGDAIGEASAKAKANRDAYKKRTDKLNSQIDKLTEANYKQFEQNLENNLKAAGVGGASATLSSHTQTIQSNMRRTYADQKAKTSNSNVAARAANTVVSGAKAGSRGIADTATRGVSDVKAGLKSTKDYIVGSNKDK